jgi:uncharacterized ion transporter superfamily protein YfcC
MYQQQELIHTIILHFIQLIIVCLILATSSFSKKYWLLQAPALLFFALGIVSPALHLLSSEQRQANSP